MCSECFIPLLFSCKVPELAAFLLISLAFQLPILLFFLTDEGLIILPLEQAVHALYLAFLLGEVLSSFVALRVMTRKLTLQFHLRQFRPVDTSSMFSFSCGNRSVLPVLPTLRDAQPKWLDIGAVFHLKLPVSLGSIRTVKEPWKALYLSHHSS